MCGIVGVLGSGVDAELLRAGAVALKHRGPDNQRVWVSPDRSVGFGHSRLSIIDLDGGDQPLESEDGSLRVVVNGEFYDFERIRSELTALGHTFRTQSDSEILVHLYEEFGLDCLHHLRGEYAFLLWDSAHGVLIAGRDRFGIKPLYFATHQGSTYFASEAKALFAMGVPARLNREMMISGELADPNGSYFTGVRQLPPGCYLEAWRGKTAIHSYWDVKFPLESELPATYDPQGYVEELRHVFHEAVRLRLRADVPVACYLSGGIDSCAVLGVASSYASRPLRAYTLSFDHADYDERCTAEKQAKLSGADFFPIDIRSADLAEGFSDAVYHAERPFINAHCVAKFHLSRAVQDDGTRVVLTGEGSDEVFAGYAPFRKDFLGHIAKVEGQSVAADLLRKLDEANRVSQGLLLGESGDPNLEDMVNRLGYSPAYLEPTAIGRTAMMGLLSDSARESASRLNPFSAFLDSLDVPGRLAGRHPVNQSLYLWGKSLLPNYILSNLGDRMEMAHSVEGRVPFMDHKVAECAARMPVGMKIREMAEKYVLREAAKPVLTEEVYRRQKHPFLAPPSTLQSDGLLYTMVQDTLRGPSLDALGIYNRAAVVWLLDALPSMDDGMRARIDPGLMTMLSYCLLHERFEAA